ncbi:MAG: hypothetical protein IJP29_01890 [Lachnospiraceae bacterium]|nr:hypothetical protein [Lachnospiraceae bacterium]
MKYVVFAILIILFLYMMVWSFKLYFHLKRQKKVKRIQELRAKAKEPQQHVDENRDYWFNVKELEGCEEGEEATKCYHYFSSVQQGVRELLVEMYDYGIVRTDELTEIAYGQSFFDSVDLSFLKDMESTTETVEMTKKAVDDTEPNKESETMEKPETVLDDVIQVDGVAGGFFSKPKPTIVEAAKDLKGDDPGITDLHGTLSKGVENVLAAVEAEKQEEEKKNEPILKKQEKSVEEARKAREVTSNAEIRNKIYEKWIGYVDHLYQIIGINASEDTKTKIHKALIEYGYNDVDVLLESPE